MIEVKNLTKKFNGFTAVDHISFDVKKSEIFGLLGPNGAGKTTTIRMLSTLTRPTEGSAQIGGFDIVKQDNKVRQLIGLVSEKMIMYDRLTAKENLSFFGKLYNIPKTTLNQRIDELLSLVQLTKWKDSKVGTFSTGMKQRMNVVRALLNLPQVLFLDEPTLGLDPQSTVEVREFVKKINQENKTTIILTTHMMNEADILCDRIGIIDHGKIASLDTPTNLKNSISGENTTILTLEIANLTPDLIYTVRDLECVETVSQENTSHLKVHAHGEGSFDSIIDAIRAKKGNIVSIQNIQPTLEDVFLHITGRTMRDKANKKIPLPNHGRFRSRSRVR
ncbi:MAG: ATP-binding cassette domain-containing protein [Candidatus Bathyarchaeota archaeon]